MKPIKGWILVWKDGEPDPAGNEYGPQYAVYTVRTSAVADRRDMAVEKNWRIVRVEIREAQR